MARALANIEANLDQRDAAAFRAVMRRDEPRISGSWKQLVESRRELAHELIAEPFDKRGAKQALIAWRTAGSHFLDEFSDTLIDALAQISPEGRRKIVAQREQGWGASQ
jgi:hypothetical protein